jgi:hypothetical protein
MCIVCVLENSMSPLFGRRVARRACVAIFVAVAGVVPAQADTVSVAIDQALVMNMPGQVSTIVIGNPLIADATLQRGGVLIVTGKGYGETNIVALNRDGRVLMEKTLQVVGPENVVFVYKGIERESYSCTPECDRRVTLGDSPAFFGATIGQIGSRNGQAASGGGGGGPSGR